MLDDEKKPIRYEPWVPVFIAFFVFGLAIFLLLRPVFTITQTVVLYTLQHGINGGLATLLGAIIGFSALAKQAKTGFYNLKVSQENQAILDREAREHQQALVIAERESSFIRQKKSLAAAFYGELSYIKTQLKLHKDLIELQIETYSKKPDEPILEDRLIDEGFPSIRNDIFKKNVENLGIFEPELVSSIVIIMNYVVEDRILYNIVNKKPKSIVGYLEKRLVFIDGSIKRVESVMIKLREYNE